MSSARSNPITPDDLSYDLIRSRRKTVGIIVSRDGRVTVRAPRRASQKAIEAIVKKRSGWIRRKLAEFERMPPAPPPKKYVDGERHLFLGDRYQLQLAQGRPGWVELSNDHLTVTTHDLADRDRIKRQLIEWYRQQAHRLFAERLDACFPLFDRFDVPYPELKVRQMKSRWGSCHSNGRIILNLRLIQVPNQYIDYVIIHELCHLVEPNHGRGFYTLLQEVLPHWRELRARLNGLEIA